MPQFRLSLFQFPTRIRAGIAGTSSASTGNRQKTNRRKAVKPEITRWIVRYLLTVRLTLSSAVLHHFAGLEPAPLMRSLASKQDVHREIAGPCPVAVWMNRRFGDLCMCWDKLKLFATRWSRSAHTPLRIAVSPEEIESREFALAYGVASRQW